MARMRRRHKGPACGESRGIEEGARGSAHKPEPLCQNGRGHPRGRGAGRRCPQCLDSPPVLVLAKAGEREDQQCSKHTAL